MMTTSESSLIPRKLLFGKRGRDSCKISADGAWLAWLEDVAGVRNIWIRDIRSMGSAQPITTEDSHDIVSFVFATNSQQIFYLRDTNGNENTHLYIVDMVSGSTRDLTPFGNIQARLLGLNDDDPHTIAVAINDRIAEWHDVYLIDCQSNVRSLVLQNDKRLGSFLFDRQLNLRAASRIIENNVTEFLTITDGRVAPFFEAQHEDFYSASLLSFNRAGDALYLLKPMGTDTSALVRYEWSTGREDVVFENPDGDVMDVVWEPEDCEAQLVCIEKDRRRWFGLQQETQQALQHLNGLYETGFDIVSVSRDNRRWLISTGGDRPSNYVLFDRSDGQVTDLLSSRPDLNSRYCCTKQVLEFRARDRLEFSGYCTAPVGKRTSNSTRPPAVLYVHGGPWWRDSFDYSPVHHWLSDRGYAVLSVNFRGSRGFGTHHLNAGDREWGGKMLDDLVDAIKITAEHDLIDPERVAIMGESYGGYAALSGLAFAPDVFKCGIAICAPANLETLIASIPPYWTSYYENIARRVGDPRTAEGKAILMERSPVHQAERMCAPLLIAQGGQDVRVKPSESEQIVAALQKHDHPVVYLRFDDEGHGIVRPNNSMAFYAAAEAFLSCYLGGACEPISDEIAVSSARIEAGSEMIANLIAKCGA